MSFFFLFKNSPLTFFLNGYDCLYTVKREGSLNKSKVKVGYPSTKECPPWGGGGGDSIPSLPGCVCPKVMDMDPFLAFESE